MHPMQTTNMTTALKSYTPTRKPRPIPAVKAEPAVSPLQPATGKLDEPRGKPVEGNHEQQFWVSLGLPADFVPGDAYEGPLPPDQPEPTEILADDYQPRELTFEEVCHWLMMNPGVRRFFVNARGEIVRKWVEEYVWSTRESGGVLKIPRWWLLGGRLNVQTGLIDMPETEGNAK